jgi:hypothetical protein
MRFVCFAVLLGLVVQTGASQSDLTLVRTLDLRGDTHHVQGIDFDERHAWVTSVDKAGRKGYLQEFALDTGEGLRTVEVTRGVRYHPGGLSVAGESLWMPVAEYRRESSSVIQKRSLRTLELESEFDVADHIGCVAVGAGVLVGANWDGRDFYIWNEAGQLQRKVPNPTSNAYQDIKFEGGRLVAAGHLSDQTGAVDWLEYPSLRLLRRVPLGKTSRGVPYTNEGMAIHGVRLFLLPEDAPSRLFEFRLAAPVVPEKK